MCTLISLKHSFNECPHAHESFTMLVGIYIKESYDNKGSCKNVISGVSWLLTTISTMYHISFESLSPKCSKSSNRTEKYCLVKKLRRIEYFRSYLKNLNNLKFKRNFLMKQSFSVQLTDLEHWCDKLSNDIWYMVEIVVRSRMTPEITF